MEIRRHNIGVTTICPGLINTPILRTSVTRGAHAEERAERIARLHERRGYTPEKVAVNILRAVGRNRAVAPIAPEAHRTYALTRVAPPLARWFSARTSAVLSEVDRLAALRKAMAGGGVTRGPTSTASLR